MATVTDAIKPVMDLAVATAAKVAALESRIAVLEAKPAAQPAPGAPASAPALSPELAFWVKPADADVDTLIPKKPSNDPVEIKNRARYGYSLSGSRTRFRKYFHEAWAEIEKLFATKDSDLPYWKNGRYNKLQKPVAAYLLLTHYNFIAGHNTSAPDYAIGKSLDAVIAFEIAEYAKQMGDDTFPEQGPSGVR